jgi:hypothetical protein
MVVGASVAQSPLVVEVLAAVPTETQHLPMDYLVSLMQL